MPRALYDVAMEEMRRGKSARQKSLIKLFCGKPPTLYQAGLVRVFGFQLGLLLSKLAYWEGKQSSSGGWIYKTAKDLEDETGLTAANQKHAIRIGKKLGVIEMTYRQVPRKRHYKVLWKKVAEIVEFEAPKHGLKVSKSLMELGDNNPTITKTTQNTTTKNSLSKNSVGNILKNSYTQLLRHRGRK